LNQTIEGIDVITTQDSQDLSAIGDGVIGLTVTSPPYWNAIDYDRFVDNPDTNYRTREYDVGFSGYEDYLDWLETVFTGVLEKTSPGGHLAIVVGTVLLNGHHYPVPMDLTARLTRKGWEFRQDIVWHKVTAGVRRAGTFIQHPFPGYYHPNIMTEYILVFRRPGSPIYREKTPEKKENARIKVGDIFTKEIANNVWHIAPVPPGHLDHPAPFPEDIPFRLILLYSYPGDIVFDPFNGSGQTTKVACHLGRHYIGYDIQEAYTKYARRRLCESLQIRDKVLIAKFEHIIRNGGFPIHRWRNEYQL